MAIKMSTQHLIRLKEQLLAVQSEIRELHGKEAGLKAAIAIVSDEPEPLDSINPGPVKRRPIKDIVLRIIDENAVRGLVAVDVVGIAKSQGITLDRNSVSSLLSRFKHDGILEYDGTVYRPNQRPFPREVKGLS